MTTGLAAMLLGVFVVPVLLLWLGHRLRRRTPRQHRIFWGALAGHLASLPIAMLAAMIPPAEWSPADVLRGALGLWLPLVAPVVGAALGAMLGAMGSPGRDDPRD